MTLFCKEQGLLSATCSSGEGHKKRTSGSARTSSLYLSHSGDMRLRSDSSIRMKPPTCGFHAAVSSLLTFQHSRSASGMLPSKIRVHSIPRSLPICS